MASRAQDVSCSSPSGEPAIEPFGGRREASRLRAAVALRSSIDPVSAWAQDQHLAVGGELERSRLIYLKELEDGAIQN